MTMERVLEPEVMEGEGEAAIYEELDERWGDVIFQGFAETAVRLGVTHGRVLDVGTGSGRLAVRLARLNPDLRIEAIDLSDSMLALARQNAARAATRNVTFLRGDAKAIPYPDGTFDMVISHQLLHHCEDPVHVLREINRVAKPDGALLIRDVRRLRGRVMDLALPFWCWGYSPKLKELTAASFRAGLSLREFRSAVSAARIDRAAVHTEWLTHQTALRPARPCSPFLGQNSSGSRLIGFLRSRYVDRA